MLRGPVRRRGVLLFLFVVTFAVTATALLTNQAFVVMTVVKIRIVAIGGPMVARQQRQWEIPPKAQIFHNVFQGLICLLGCEMGQIIAIPWIDFDAHSSRSSS